ncbi:hypothetical protein KCG44_01045 [Pacificimonas sp. WHA3]|uniref:HemY N-terminal domain-containing protein n=1 Tax=Pacificimonas pallii TaxID=2827236 RepID=A0ABS6SBX5_9SPHN|nr:hypothetical protein [Pacificimonas pallii]
MHLEWFGWEINFHPVWLLAAAAALWFVFHVARRLWNWLRWKSGLFGPARQLRRQKAALGNASAALGALVSGQEERAAALAQDALKSDPTNSMAQAVAALTGDTARIAELDRNNATKSLAALARLRTAPDLSVAREATRAAPTSAAAWQALVEESARSGDYAHAISALSNWRALDDTAERLGSWIEASLLTAAADAELDDEPARTGLSRALKAEPRFAPAATRLALLAEEASDVSGAERAAESVWSVQPTPTLARAFADLYPLETDETRLARLQKLAAKNPENPESLLIVSEAALTAGDPALALETVSPLLSDPPIRLRAAAVAMEAHRRLGMDPPTGALWLDAAATGAPGLRWHCANCRTESVEWELECQSCKRIGILLPGDLT